MANDGVRDIGFTIVHQPKDNSTPVADVILVHGLQGHPRRTWLHSPIQGQASPSSSASDEGHEVSSPTPRRTSTGISGLARAMSWRSHHTTPSISGVNKCQDDDGIYWPKDLLSKDCPGTRIMVWGYDTAVTRGFSAVNKSDLFSHARDLLYSIDRQRPKGRKIVFVAHSLGGLLVKEMLRRAEESGENTSVRDILTSTVAVLFLGTPHRGSADFAKLGDITRRVAGTVLRVDTNSYIIRSLGINSPELELSRESFLRQWQAYGFQVKTFQEGRAMTGVNIGRLKDKVVPDSSSSLDDPRECAETIHADHRSMTKYWGSEDPNYGKVGGEITRIIGRISQETLDTSPAPILSVEAQLYLQSLAFESMFDRQDNINTGLADTCRWLQEANAFTAWSSRQNVSIDHGLLWVKGKPGAGKSTLMKSAVAAIKQSEEGRSNIATFYFNARGDHLEKTPLGLLRSVLHQLCRQDVHVLGEFHKLCQEKRTRGGGQVLSWTASELEVFMRRLFSQRKPRRTFLFIDALDECANLSGNQAGEHTVRQVVYLLFEIARSAFDSGLSLNICLSSRHYPTISLPDCPEIVVEEGNASDIAIYVRDMFRMVPSSEVGEIENVQSLLIDKASGVFLWVVLVVAILLRDIHNGQPMSKILDRLKAVPKRMEDLYVELLGSLTAEERLFSVPLVQWVLLRKGRITDELHAICLAARLSGINRAPTVNDFADWGYAEPPIWQHNDRMLRFVKSASRGLIEYTFGTVKFIHETVREFFLHGPGFKVLDARLCQNPCGLGYSSLVTGCLNILDLSEQHGNLAPFREHAVKNLMTYAREVEVHHGNNTQLLNRLQSPGSRSWKLLCHNTESMLHFMSRCNLTSAVLELLNQGPNREETDRHDRNLTSPLIAALSQDFIPDKALIEGLVTHGADLGCIDRDGNTPLLLAFKRGLNETVDLLFPFSEVNAVDFDGEGLLHWSLDAINHEPTHEGYREKFNRLLGCNINVNVKSAFDTRPIHIAARGANLDAMQKLISAGAEINVGDENRASPLILLMQSSSSDLERCLDLLITRGADPNFKDGREQTALHHAVKFSTPEALSQIVAAGADVHARDKDGFNALHFAAFNLARRLRDLSWGRLAVPTLIKAGCSLQEKNSAGRTPLDHALFTNRSERAALGVARLSDEIVALLGGSTGPRVAWTSGQGIFV